MTEKARIHAKTLESEQKYSNSCKQKPNFNSSGSPADGILHLQRTAGNKAVQRLIKSRALQAKLRISQSNDIYEQEADGVAEQVMKMPDPASVPQSLVSSLPEGSSTQSATHYSEKDIQRKEDDNEEEEIVQMKRGSPPYAAGSQPSVPPTVHEVLSSPGLPLDPATRAHMEPRFGHDFSQVRVHSDDAAALAAYRLQAKAFALGEHVVFSRHRFAPNTTEGQRLLAHELTHVVQQTTSLLNSDSSDQHQEHEATVHGILANRVPLKIREHSQKGIALTPESLSTSLDVSAMSDDDIRTELREIRLWMAGQISTNEQYLILEEVRQELQDELTRRHRERAKAEKAKKKSGRKKGKAATTETLAHNLPAPRSTISSFDITELTPEEQAEELQLIDEWLALNTPEDWSTKEIKKTQRELSGQLAKEKSAPLLESHNLKLARVVGTTLRYTERKGLDRYQAIEILERQIERARNEASLAISAIDMIYEQRNEMPVRSWISEAAGGAEDPEKLLDKWSHASDLIRLATDELDKGNFAGAANLLNESLDESNSAVIGVNAYFGDVVTGGERTVTGLEVVKVTAAAAVTIYTGGAYGVAAGVTVGGAYSGTQTIAQQASEIHYGLRDKIDWAGVGFDVVMGAVSGYLGGSLGNVVFRRLLANPASASFGAKALSYAVSDYIAGRTGSTIHFAARTAFDMARGRDITWEQFLDQLADQITDPKQAAFDLILGHASRRATAGKFATEASATTSQSDIKAPGESVTIKPSKLATTAEPPKPVEPKEIIGEPVRLPPQPKPLYTAKNELVGAMPKRPPLVDKFKRPIGAKPKKKIGILDQYRQPVRKGGRRPKPELLGPDERPLKPAAGKPKDQATPTILGPDERPLVGSPKSKSSPIPRPDERPARGEPQRPSTVLEPGGQQVISGARVHLEEPVVSPKVWEEGISVQGLTVEKAAITQRYPDAIELPKGFPTFDAVDGGKVTPIFAGQKRGALRTGEVIEGGTAISIKSANLSDPGYMSAKGTYKNLKKYLDDIDSYPAVGRSLSRRHPTTGQLHQVTVVNSSKKVLHVELSRTPTPEQMDGLARIRFEAKEKGIDVVFVAPR